LLKCLQNNPNKIKAVISASAIGWYGSDNGKVFTEEDPAANDFLGQTCAAWENSIQPVVELGKRLVKLRLGIVLSNEGGALREFKKPLALGVAAILGDGKQMTSWIHIDDLCRGFLFAIENRELEGVYNLAAPEPVDNKTLMLTLAQNRKRKSYVSFNVPSSLLKLALGEMSVEILKSATVSSLKIQQAGFNFIYPNIKSAINNLSN